MNINEEVKRMRVLMGLNENIANNNFAQMGITRKTISRGGVMYQEQDMVGGVDLSKPFEPAEDNAKSEFDQEVEEKKDDIEQEVMDYRREVSDNKEDAEDDEEDRKGEIEKQTQKREEEKQREEEEEKEEKEEKERKKEEEELRKKEELEARLAAQRERTT
tara:strand:+ start:102 stop:584 length:483 start_codon:yes stop_codon:yes gene_type:complete